MEADTEPSLAGDKVLCAIQVRGIRSKMLGEYKYGLSIWR